MSNYDPRHRFDDEKEESDIEDNYSELQESDKPLEMVKMRTIPEKSVRAEDTEGQAESQIEKEKFTFDLEPDANEFDPDPEPEPEKAL